MTLHADQLSEKVIRDGVYDVLINSGYVASRDDEKFYVDSLDSVAMVLDMENKFDISIPDSDIEKMVTPTPNLLDANSRPPVLVQSIVDYIVSEKKL